MLRSPKKKTSDVTSRRKSLMQRLQSWFEGLPLGRGSRERRSRKASHSAAPTCRIPEPESKLQRRASIVSSKKARCLPIPVKEPTAPVIYQDPWDRKALPVDLPMGGSLSQSFTRKGIRTNPWIARDRSSMRISSGPSTGKLMPSSNMSISSMDRSQLRVKSFEESVCSSGYGSQDSSPESSVHSPNWQTTREDKAIECRSIDVDEALGFLEETSSFGPYDNLKCCDSEEHIYHELESLTRISRVLDDRAYASDSECSPSCSSLSRAPSPIYARPYEGPMARPYVEDGPFAPARGPFPSSEFPRLPDVASLPRNPANNLEDPVYSTVPTQMVRPRMLPLTPQTVINPAVPMHRSLCGNPMELFRKDVHMRDVMNRNPYAKMQVPLPLRPIPVRPAPTFHAPPPPPLPLDDTFERVEMDFLAELDAQIAELQMKSDAVRSLVDEARGRRRIPSEDDWCRPPRWQNPRFELRL